MSYSPEKKDIDDNESISSSHSSSSSHDPRWKILASGVRRVPWFPLVSSLNLLHPPGLSPWESPFSCAMVNMNPSMRRDFVPVLTSVTSERAARRTHCTVNRRHRRAAVCVMLTVLAAMSAADSRVARLELVDANIKMSKYECNSSVFE